MRSREILGLCLLICMCDCEHRDMYILLYIHLDLYICGSLHRDGDKKADI